MYLQCVPHLGNKIGLPELQHGDVNGHQVRAGRLVDADNAPVATERPQQIFTRWYGFSLTFPNPEIYE